MRSICKKSNCTAPRGLCLEHASNDYQECEHWINNNDLDKLDTHNNSKADELASKQLPWTGEPFQPDDIHLTSQRSTPLIIGMIGGADAGKTSYLGMLYTLLFNGKKLKNWSFAGSYSLAAWETLSQYLKIKPDGETEFAPPTPSNPNYYSLYHLALKREDLFRDIFFADSSGEVFKIWSEDINDPNAINARWIYSNASAFIFMVDSEALIKKRGIAKKEIVNMARQISANIRNRPVAVVWSKADRIQDIRENIKTAVTKELTDIFNGAEHFQVSNYSRSDPDTLCHKNNMLVTEYLLEEMNKTQSIKLEPQYKNGNDTFFNYKGTI